MLLGPLVWLYPSCMLKALHAASDVTGRVGQLSQSGVAFAACGNTMKSQNVLLGDLLPGFVSTEQGGVSGSRNCGRRDISICGLDTVIPGLQNRTNIGAPSGDIAPGIDIDPGWIDMM